MAIISFSFYATFEFGHERKYNQVIIEKPDHIKTTFTTKWGNFALENGIDLKQESNYYPHGKSLGESTNKNLSCIIKRIVFSK